jgi:hypothetical protein
MNLHVLYRPGVFEEGAIASLVPEESAVVLVAQAIEPIRY